MEAASSFFLPRLIGYGRAMHVVATGAVYRADDALLSGLFSEFADTAEGVVRRAVELAEEVAGNVSAVSGFLSRELMWRGKGSAEEQHLLDSRVLANLRGKGDNSEGVRAFMEKRPASFEASVNDLPGVHPWWDIVETKASGEKDRADDLGKGKLDSSKLRKGKKSKL